MIAHGGTAGAIGEGILAVAVVGVLIAVWLRERSARREEEDSRDPGD